MNEKMEDKNTANADPHRVVRKNAVLSMMGNFVFAAAVGALASALGPVFTDDPVRAWRTFAAISTSVACIVLACYIVSHKEKEP